MSPTTQSRVFVTVICLLAAAFIVYQFIAVSPASNPGVETLADPQPSQYQPRTKTFRQRHVTWPLPPSDASDEDLLRLARQYVAISPEQAILWAQAAEAAFSERLLFAVARAWGELDPQSAAGWALLQNSDYRFKRMEAVLAGAVLQPEVALKIGRALLARDLTSGNSYGTALVADLIAVHQYRIALELSSDAMPAVHSQWNEMIFSCWAREQPQKALEALRSTSDETVSPSLFRSLTSGWAQNDPASLAGYAVALPPGDSRSYALNRALDEWLNRDPVSMAEWLNSLPQSAETDAAAQRLICRTDLANRSTEVALGWVAQIGDLSLKASALEHVLNEWAQSDLNGATNYLATVTWLTPEKQRTIVKKISTPRTPDAIALTYE